MVNLANFWRLYIKRVDKITRGASGASGIVACPKGGMHRLVASSLAQASTKTTTTEVTLFGLPKIV